MPFEVPTLKTLRERVRADFKSELGVKSFLPRSLLGALGNALAGTSYLLHRHIAYVLRQVFPTTAEKRFLEEWARIFGVSRLSATFAQAEVELSGNLGAVVPQGTRLKLQNNLEYTTDAEVTFSNLTETVSVTASEAGTASALSVSDTLEFFSPIAGVNSEATVTTVLIEPSDEETDEALRTRLIDRIQNPPAGGTVADYRSFALGVAGVSRAWVHPGLGGVGRVGVSFVQDANDPIIPSPAKVLEVQTAIEDLKPVQDILTVFAPTPRVLDLQIAITPNTVAVQDAITEELRDMLRREANVRGAWKSVTESYTGIITVSKIREAISIAAGEEDHALLNISADVQPDTGGIVTLGAITWLTL